MSLLRDDRPDKDDNDFVLDREVDNASSNSSSPPKPPTALPNALIATGKREATRICCECIEDSDPLVSLRADTKSSVASSSVRCERLPSCALRTEGRDDVRLCERWDNAEPAPAALVPAALPAPAELCVGIEPGASISDVSGEEPLWADAKLLADNRRCGGSLRVRGLRGRDGITFVGCNLRAGIV